MKNILTICCFALLSSFGFAQDNAITTLFDDVADMDNVTRVNISGKMFEIFSGIEGETEEERETLDIIRNLKGMKVLVLDSVGVGVNMYKDGVKRLGNDYEVLMDVNHENGLFTFYGKDGPNNKLSELLMIWGDDTNFGVMSINGLIDLANVYKLSKSLDIEGLENLEQLAPK